MRLVSVLSLAKKFKVNIPISEQFLAFTTALWQIWLPLVVTSIWMRLLALYYIPYCERFAVTPFIRGISSDMGIVALFSAVLVAFIPWRMVRLFFVVLYCFMLASNVDFITENDSNLDFGMVDQAFNAAFIESSVINEILLDKFFQGIAIFLTLYVFLVRFRPNKIFSHYIFPMLIAFAVTFCIGAPVERHHATWKQTNLLEDFGRDFFLSKNVNTNIDTSAAQQFFTKDLSGKPIAKFPAKPGTNVLLVIMESVGNDHFERGWLPYLQRLSKRSLYYPNYLTASSNTINGEYAMLCADAPSVAIPRAGAVKAWMFKRGSQDRLYCLPRVLSSAGYQTVYMQSADLEFQRKRHFMGLAGFKEMYGKAEIAEITGNNWDKWGPDDMQLYDHAFDKISSMRNNGDPWFMTLMTISTHYPANVPESYKLRDITNPNNRERSSHFASDALKGFITRLESAGVLDNTLVIITNDEVRTGGNNTPKGLMRKNRGVMMILTPEKERYKSQDAFTQTDVFLSVADYLGIPTEKIQVGRSLFREYGTFVPMFYGNYFTRYFTVLPAAGDVLVCATSDLICRQFRTEPDKTLFESRRIKRAKLKPKYASMVKQLATLSYKSRPAAWEDGDEVTLPEPTESPATGDKKVPVSKKK